MHFAYSDKRNACAVYMKLGGSIQIWLLPSITIKFNKFNLAPHLTSSVLRDETNC